MTPRADDATLLQGVPPEIVEAVSRFGESLQSIEELVGHLQAQPWSQICGPNLAPLDSARLHLMIAYTVNALFWMYLRTQGCDAHSHPVRAELERVKKALRKVKEAEERAAASAAASSEGGGALDSHGGTSAQISDAAQVRLNAAAAKRFVVAALNGTGGGSASSAAGSADASAAAASAAAPAAGRAERLPVAAELVADYSTALASAEAAAGSARASEQVRIKKQLKKELGVLEKRRGGGGGAANEAAAQLELEDVSAAEEMATSLIE